MKARKTVSLSMCLLPVTGLLMVSSSIGCVKFVANLMYAAHGNLVPAKFDGLEGKRVAVVCVSNTEAFGPNPISPHLADRVSKLLARNVDEITCVDQQDIADWIDRNDWDHMDFVAIGKAVTADRVVAINLNSFSLYDGKTMYKGRSDYEVAVHDVATGKEIFVTSPPQLEYPKNSPQHTTDMSEGEFRRRYVDFLASHIARNFYPYDAHEDVAVDASLISASSF
jgi:hypothetical protein